MTLLNSCLSAKELGLYLNFEFLWQTTQFCRALALQALVECLSRNWWGLGLKLPISLNWVRFRPGICDGGATSSTEGGLWDRRPTHGCLGLAPMRGSKQWGIDILPIFLLRVWVQSSNVNGFLGLSSYLRGVFVNYTEVFNWGQARGGENLCNA